MKNSRFLSFLGLALLTLLLVFVFWWRGLFMGIQNTLQNKFYDHDSASSEIVIVAIDEDSLSADGLGSLSQWPREHYAKTIQQLNGLGAAAIGIDLTFPDRSPLGASDDQALAEALEQYGNVVLAARYYFDQGRLLAEWPNRTLQEADPILGWINVRLDEDGFVRQLPVFQRVESQTIEAFAVAVAREYLRVEPVGDPIQSDTFLFSPNHPIPVTVMRDEGAGQEAALMNINYFAEPGSFRQISFADALNGNMVDKQGRSIDFTDKIVLIGPTAADLQDDYLSPVSSGVKMPGVEIHANAVQTIVEGEFLREQSPLSLWITILALLLINLALFSFLRVRYALPVLLLELIAFPVAALIAYEYGVLVNAIYPWLTAALSFVGSYLLRFALEQKRRRFIEKAFGQYVNKEVVKQIQKHPETLKLGGVKRRLTVLFSDIQGFTTLSETMKPEELVAFLNEYLEEMTQIILNHEGTLDKYEGDAIMALWNAPLEQVKPALKACTAALECQDRLAKLRKKWLRQGKPQVHVRIGLNTGDAVVGNMGSERHFDYTAMGDNVNLASRLEGVNKFYGTPILISEATFKEVESELVCLEIDRIRVKGKHEPVGIYQLICKEGEQTPAIAQRIQKFSEALALYRHRQFSEAKELFDQLKNDPPAQVFAQRCADFLKTPPPTEWEGVWVFEEK